jgi:hypothetical protein
MSVFPLSSQLAWALRGLTFHLVQHSLATLLFSDSLGKLSFVHPRIKLLDLTMLQLTLTYNQ